jgi:uncharacterized protein (TIGR00369 family)
MDYRPDLTRRAKNFVAQLQHCKVLGFEVVEANEKFAIFKAPYNEKLIGNPSNGVIHGGVLTTLMDTACGTVVICAIEEFELCPTLDLRIDYMRPAIPGQDIIAKAECYRITKNVVFTRSIIHQGDPEDPIAHCVATFMRIGAHLSPPDFKAKVLGEG